MLVKVHLLTSSATRTALRGNIFRQLKVPLRFFSAVEGAEASSSTVNSKDEQILLYAKTQSSTIRLMLGISVVNFYAWSAVLFNYYFFQGQIVQGIDLSGDKPIIGYVGLGATFFVGWLSRYYAHRSVYYLWMTADRKQIIIQTHTILGLPGKKFQIPTSAVKFIKPLNESLQNSQKKGIFGSSYLPLKIEGLTGNYLVEVDGFKDIRSPFVELLDPKSTTVSSLDSKQSRLNWLDSRKNKTSKKK